MENPTIPEIRRYLCGQDRNEDYALTHTYVYDANGGLWPMCEYGWNRSNGEAFSIFRSPGTGACGLCRRAVAQRKQPVFEPRGHKTKWL